jgi:GrpB-like predicted nucleotidyltransferase (UPF0157 family)
MKPVLVLDYDPAWPDAFDTEKTVIAHLLGKLVGEIHHIGSTAVPGLPAKPKIDIDAMLRSEALIPAAIDAVASDPAFTFHGDPYGDGMWTFTAGRGPYGTRLYLCAPDNPKHTRRMLFRDWLRAHPEDAAAYAALKRRLASQADGDWDYYTGGKSDFVASIVGMAERDLPSPLAGEGGSALLRRDG